MSQKISFILFILIMATQYFYFESQFQDIQRQKSSSQIAIPTDEPTRNVLQLPAFAELAEKSKNSVVSIEVSNSRSRQQTDGMGSGFIISEDGYLLSNNHVTEGANRIVVNLANGSEYDAKLVGSDPETDLSLLKIDVNGLTPFEFGSVDKTRVGSWVMAIGAPFGFEQTVTAGIVSAKGRSVGEQYVPYIQTDVAINVGNSGGPLINLDGKVIGINSKIISTFGGSLGLSFAIPIDLAIDVVNQLKTDGKVRRGFLGVGYREVTRDIAESFSLQHNYGALINSVAKNSPAERSGLEIGDIVTAVDGKAIVNYTELPFLVGRLRPGMSTELSIIRDGDAETISLVVGSRDPQEQLAIDNQQAPINSMDNPLKIKVSEMSEEVLASLELTEGLLVEMVEPGPAADAGLSRGDIILSIQTTPMLKLADFDRLMNTIPESGTFALLVTRPGLGTHYVVVELNDR